MKFLPGKRFVIVFLAVAAVMMLPLAAQATLVDVPIGSSMGNSTSNTISSDPGVIATQEWADGGFSIEATVTRLAYAGKWVFEYAYEVTAAAKDISHLIIGVTAGQPGGTFWTGGVAGVADPLNWLTGSFFTATSAGASNPGMPFISPDGFYGIKFTPAASTTDYAFTFYSYNKPVWADFYAVDGKSPGAEVYAYNRGFGTDPGEPYSGLFTIGPNGAGGNVPIPPTALLLGSGLLGLGLVGWRRKKQQF